MTEYKTKIGGNWFSPTTWNVLPSANVSYPNSFSDAFCMEGSDTVVVLDSDATVGRMIGGGGAFSGNKVVGSGKLTFDSHYDSTNSYDYSASALWETEILLTKISGVHYTTSDDKSWMVGYGRSQNILCKKYQHTLRHTIHQYRQML
ncbi:MAG: hypothetical protein ACLUKN_17235 [Bacilli bacterium]